MSKSNHFKQYLPNFCSGFELFEFDFDTLEELLSYPRIKEWKENPGFIKFMKSENRLMGLHKNGEKYEWYVLGSIIHPELIDLPEWRYEDYKEDES